MIKVVLVCLGLVLPGGLPVSAQTAGSPYLQLIATNHGVRAQWDIAGYYYLLQSSINLGATNAWIDEACASPVVASSAATFQYPNPIFGATNFTTNQIAYDLSLNESAKFFRMQPPHYLPLCSFAIFYLGPMEFSQTATMIVNGPVYASGPILVGTSASLTFNDVVTTSSTISAPFMDGLSSGWSPDSPAGWNTSFFGNPSTVTNVLPISPLITATNFHAMIDLPGPGETVSMDTNLAHLYYQAEILVLVTNDFGATGNSTVSVTLQNWSGGTLPGADPLPVVLVYTNVVSSPALPFLSLTNRFYDQREYKTNLVTQIDVGRFATWVATNSIVQSKLPSIYGIYPTVLYVADRRNHATNQMTCVRLMNGAQLPGNGGVGFTVVTPGPLYVWGNYNVQTAGSAANASAGTTNISSTVPAALYSDALTLLSSHWTDISSFTAYSQSSVAFDAVDDTVNAVLVTGNMPSTDSSGTGFSGGVHNLARFLEDWSNANLWLNTSLCRLWTSQTATNQFRNPAGFVTPPVNPYYNPPTRHYSYDPNLSNPAKIPPGVPIIVNFGAE